jgi:hypothetical protein
VGSRERREPARSGHHRSGRGSAAAIALNNDLVDEDLSIAVSHYRPGLPD